MKKALKRATSIFCAVAAALTCLNTATIAFAEAAFAAQENLAWTATVAVDSNPTNVTAINDGKLSGNEWQSPLPSERTESNPDAWVSLTWPQAKTVNKLIVYATGGSKSRRNYVVQVYNGTTWIDVQTEKTEASMGKGTVYADADGTEGTQGSNAAWTQVTMTFADQTTTAIRINQKDFKSNTTTDARMWIRELEAYGPAQVEPPVEPPVEPTESINIALASNGGTPFASSQKNSAKTEYVNDGDVLRWQPTDNNDFPTPKTEYVGVMWDTAKSFKDITLYWRDTNNSPATDSYVVEISNDTTTGLDGTWTEVTLEVKSRGSNGTYSTVAPHLTGSDNANRVGKDTIVLADVAKAKAVRLNITLITKQAQLAEFEVYSFVDNSFAGQEQLESSAASGITNLVDRLILTNIAEEAVGEGQVVQAAYTITRNGRTEEGTVIIRRAWKSISLTQNNQSTTFDATDFGGSESEYVTGFFFRDMQASDTITVTFSVIDAPADN